MYFDPIAPQSVVHWLHGLRTGCELAGLTWDPDTRRPALKRRDLELTAEPEEGRLAAQGLPPEAIVDELLAIEIKMWEEIDGANV